MTVSISSRHEQATLANVNRMGIVGMLRADDLVSFVSPQAPYHHGHQGGCSPKSAKLPEDEARRIAANVAKPPELLRESES